MEDFEVHDKLPDNLQPKNKWEEIAALLRQGKVVSLPYTRTTQVNALTCLRRQGVKAKTHRDKANNRVYIEMVKD